MKNRKYKIKPQIIIIVIAVIAVIALIAAGIISSNSKDNDTTVGMTLTQKNLRPQDALDNNNEIKEQTTVEILMDDTAIPVGISFMASAIVEPSDTDKALVWTSSNQDVMTVEQDGLVTITGTGTAALTATVGDVSDAVAIEGIASVSAGSKNGYTVYTGNGSITRTSSGGASSGGSAGSGIASSGNTGINNGAGSSLSGSSDGYAYSSGDSSDNNSDSNNSDNDKDDSRTDSGNSSGGGNNSNSSNNNNNDGSYNNSSNNNNSNNNNNSSSNGKTSDDIADIIGNQGFKQEYSNVYVYTEDGTYYGEIITQPNVSIIYIKQRNSGFDSRIRSVLSELLPDSYNQVWNNYISATSDRTFTVEGRKVRIVTASRGGHSQIVIYN